VDELNDDDDDDHECRYYADVYGQRRNATRVRQQSRDAALPEVWLQSRRACVGFLRQIPTSQLNRVSTCLLPQTATMTTAVLTLIGLYHAVTVILRLLREVPSLAARPIERR